jgi:CBS domain containing-hemolysin-like protein
MKKFKTHKITTERSETSGIVTLRDIVEMLVKDGKLPKEALTGSVDARLSDTSYGSVDFEADSTIELCFRSETTISDKEMET